MTECRSYRWRRASLYSRLRSVYLAGTQLWETERREMRIYTCQLRIVGNQRRYFERGVTSSTPPPSLYRYIWMDVRFFPWIKLKLHEEGYVCITLGLSGNVILAQKASWDEILDTQEPSTIYVSSKHRR
jgi:hypothetical protein